MPVITIQGPAGISKEVKKELIEKVSQTAADIYNMPINTINVLIMENEADNVGVGGKQLSEINNS
ncbi:4-oxalocrotonate tautomerase DmpI [Methanosphaera cuniculi]|uniref:4-oxalocrotonate tautomerase DmpI n=1 Tax=Methanosphaera cuniculi TaxID=1077256 RepID=UPI0026EAE2C1|nr:4-oxalocrotonate tautomerase DmpI [Methanosphaera cuniculi]